MATIDHDQFKLVIEELIEKTRSGEITWSSVNPSTYTWASDSGRVVLQQVSKVIRRLVNGALKNFETKTYLFQAADMSGVIQLSVNSSEVREADEVLGKLFETISAGITRKGVDFLKSLIEKKVR